MKTIYIFFLLILSQAADVISAKSILKSDYESDDESNNKQIGSECSTDKECSYDYCCVHGVCHSDCCNWDRDCISDCCHFRQCEPTAHCGRICRENSDCVKSKCCKDSSCVIWYDNCCNSARQCTSNCCSNEHCVSTKNCGGCPNNEWCKKSNCCINEECVSWIRCQPILKIVIIIVVIVFIIGLIAIVTVIICRKNNRCKESD